MSNAILGAIADLEGTDPTEIDTSLYDIVDPDALDAVFSPTEGGTPREGGRVVLTIDTYEISVHWDGRILIRELPQTSQ